MKSILCSAAVAVAGARSYKYISGEVKTLESFTYGRFRTSMKSNNDMGTIASFFTFHEEKNFHESQWNEIDIEIVPSVQIQKWGPFPPFRSNLIHGEGNRNSGKHFMEGAG